MQLPNTNLLKSFDLYIRNFKKKFSTNVIGNIKLISLETLEHDYMEELKSRPVDTDKITIIGLIKEHVINEQLNFDRFVFSTSQPIRRFDDSPQAAQPTSSSRLFGDSPARPASSFNSSFASGLAASSFNSPLASGLAASSFNSPDATQQKSKFAKKLF